MKFTYSIPEKDFETLFHTIRVLNNTDKEFKIWIIISAIVLIFIPIFDSFSLVTFLIFFIIFFLFNTFFHNYIKKKSIDHMKNSLKWEVEIEFFDDYILAKNQQYETKTHPKEFSFWLIWDVIIYYSNPFYVNVIKLTWENEKQFVIQWLENNNIKLLQTEEVDIINYDIKKTYNRNYYFIILLWLIYLIWNILSSHSFWYLFNNIFKLCEINDADSFPCYWLYDIYAAIFIVILIFITIFLFIKNICLLKNPIIIKK